MKILYDYQVFQWQRFGGISRYFFKLLNEFKEMPNIECDLALKYTVNEHLKQGYNFKKRPYAYSSNRYLKSGFYRLTKTVNMFCASKKLKKGEFDIFHPTYYERYHIHRTTKPTVLTVYDMIHEKFHEYFEHSKETSKNKKELCEAATAILAISENTKKDLIELFNIPKEKIIVTYLSGGFEKAKYNKSIAQFLPSRYILFVGHRGGYKNFDRFLQSIVLIMEQDKDLYLICTGAKFNTQEIEKIKYFGKSIAKRIVHHFPNDEDFYTYYNRALAFVFPSIYEGFGIPTLEAFSANCPAILSNTSSLPEVGGEAVAYFDPYDVGNMEQVIKNVIYNEEKRTQMIDLGRERLKRFSWLKTAEETKKVYESVI